MVLAVVAIFLILVVVGVVLVGTQANQEGKNETGFANSFEGNGYIIGYPQNWTQQNNDLINADFFYPQTEIAEQDKFMENLNVMVMGSEGYSLDEYADLSIQQNETLGINMLSVEEADLSGERALRVEMTQTTGGNELKFMAYWIVNEGKAYVITYTGAEEYEEYVEEAEEIILSFKLS